MQPFTSNIFRDRGRVCLNVIIFLSEAGCVSMNMIRFLSDMGSVGINVDSLFSEPSHVGLNMIGYFSKRACVSINVVGVFSEKSCVRENVDRNFNKLTLYIIIVIRIWSEKGADALYCPRSVELLLRNKRNTKAPQELHQSQGRQLIYSQSFHLSKGQFSIN